MLTAVLLLSGGRDVNKSKHVAGERECCDDAYWMCNRLNGAFNHTRVVCRLLTSDRKWTTQTDRHTDGWVEERERAEMEGRIKGVA